ncbi:reverse transcriptase domain-containing protein [Tanacetum coccineum]
MEEMLNKFIDEGKREHKEMRTFIYDFQTTNELLFKEKNNSLIELRFGVQELLKEINNIPKVDCDVKGVTTRGGKTTTHDVHDNNANVLPKEPLVVELEKPVRSNDVLTNDQPQMTSEPDTNQLKDQTTEDDECYGIDDLDDTINKEAQELLANDESDSFLLRGLEKSINQSDLECYESTSSNENDGSDLENSIRCIDYANTPYPVTQGTKKRNDVKSEHLYSVSADEIDEKKPELKNLPQHLQYAYLHGDKSFPNIILSKLSEKEKNSLLQVLERQKGKLLGKCQTSRESVRHSLLDEGILQTPIAPEDQEKTTFTCPYGTFACRRMSFGVCNAPAAFQICMTAIFHNMVEDFMEVFMDDFSVFGKCHFMVKERIVLGHKISRAGIEVDRAKIDVIAKLPYPTNVKGVRNFLGKEDAKPRLIRWVLLLQGFDIEIKDKKGAENLAANHLSRLENPDLGTFTEEEITDEFPDEHLMILKVELNNDKPWYVDYVNIVGKIDKPYEFKLCSNNVMRRCVARNEILEILVHCHSGPTEGHHSASITGRKVYEFGFYWPSIFKDAKDYVMRCDAWQRSGNISSRSEMPQNNIQVCDVFNIWGLDFMGPFPNLKGNKYILVAVDYVSKWVEAQALPTNDARVVIRFLRRLFARFRVPKALISDQGTEVTNRAIKRILERSVGYNPKNWSEKLDDALWAFRTAYKKTTRCTPFRLVYGKSCTTLRDGAYENTRIYKERTKRWHDSRLRGNKDFKAGGKVLLFNSRFKMHRGPRERNIDKYWWRIYKSGDLEVLES